jgi:hypothetical protein
MKPLLGGPLERRAFSLIRQKRKGTIPAKVFYRWCGLCDDNRVAGTKALWRWVHGVTSHRLTRLRGVKGLRASIGLLVLTVRYCHYLGLMERAFNRHAGISLQWRWFVHYKRELIRLYREDRRVMMGARIPRRNQHLRIKS